MAGLSEACPGCERLRIPGHAALCPGHPVQKSGSYYSPIPYSYEPNGNFKNWKPMSAKGFNSVKRIVFGRVPDGVGNLAHIYILSEKRCAYSCSKGGGSDLEADRHGRSHRSDRSDVGW